MGKKVLVILVDGFEEIEAVAPIDILRRAGLKVIVAGLEKKDVTGSHGIRLTADSLLKEISKIPEAMILPGGPGAEKLGESEVVRVLMKKMKASKKIIAAICAAPAVVLGRNGFLEGKKATCFPGYEKELGNTATFLKDRVVVDGPIVTSRAAGTAVEFSLELVKKLVGEKKAEEISEKILATHWTALK